MALPAFWTKNAPLEPFGSFTATDLCQNLPPKVPARGLLLGCGDPRNILNTLSLSDPGARTYDFTCCDQEPAILARSILMLSLILDDQPSSMIWEIHYNMRLDQESSSLLIKQCKKLIRFATDLTSWQNSPYGKVLRMSTSHTLSVVCHLWTRYAQFENHSGPVADQLEKKRKAVAQGLISRPGWNLSASPCAGAFFTYVNPLGSVHYNEYWETGFSTHTLGRKHTPKYLNPTLAFSSTRPQEWPLLPGSDPLMSFHLATAFAGIEGEPTNGACRANTKMEVLAKTVRKEFSDWCTSFSSHARRAPGSIIVRFVVAEALAFCQALHYCASTGSLRSGQFVSLWSAQELVLDPDGYGPMASGSAPTAFNVIDSSDLMNDMGLLNILICASPLLETEPYSALFTEALFSIAGDGTGGTALPSRTLTDPSVTALLFGLTPTSFVTKISTQENVHEIAANLILGAPKGFDYYHERLVWKFVYSGDQGALRDVEDLNQRIVVDPKQLAETLFGIYQNMFQPENPPSRSGVPTQRGLPGMSEAEYARTSMASLARIARDRTSTDWTAAIEHFLDLTIEDKSVCVGHSYYQELLCQLSARGLYTTDIWKHLSTEKVRPTGPFATWTDIPPISCVVLVVPRDRIRPLENADPKIVHTPIMQCEVFDPIFQVHSAFTSIHTVFGTLTVSDSGDASIQEDEAGWSGDSDLLAMFWVPSWELTIHPASRVIQLSLKITLKTRSLMEIFGMGLKLFSAAVTDKKYVHVFRDRPNAPGELARLSALSLPTSDALSAPEVKPVTAELGYDSTKRLHTVLTLKRRWAVRDPIFQRSLLSGSKVKVTQKSPCTLTIWFDSLKKDISFPYPVDNAGVKLHIIRKSFLIEVMVPIAGHSASGGFSHTTPVVYTPSGPVSWNVHYVNLDKMPALNINNPEAYIHALYPHVSLIFSDKENEIRDTFGPQGTTPVPSIELKDSIFSILLTSSGMEGETDRVYGIGDPENGGTNTMIFIMGIRLDLSAHTIVGDAFVLPIDKKGSGHYKRPLVALSKKAYPQSISSPIVIAWKKLLPALVERCRTWEHKSTCEYREAGSIPLSIKAFESPICSCGMGVGTEEFQKTKEWKPFAPYVTRMAISPLFPPSYLESVAGVDKKLAECAPVTPAGAGSSKSKQAECAACRKTAGETKLLVCSRCKKVSYCSQDCQKGDWKRHKAQCNAKI
ncbi:hypothetical protein BDN72DRAFT_103167 [Pluteus cervinus]|uniref:Uncharacterized protein n=1 Tax=Pluteus cervinus TaxID=181527 RepID=A0ACD3B7U7_9AGAR|nr:hypothetical protein BDN72DRAFT_103167 [Pluteus cervinus]